MGDPEHVDTVLKLHRRDFQLLQDTSSFRKHDRSPLWPVGVILAKKDDVPENGPSLPIQLADELTLSISILLLERHRSYGKPSRHLSDEERATKKR